MVLSDSCKESLESYKELPKLLQWICQIQYWINEWPEQQDNIFRQFHRVGTVGHSIKAVQSILTEVGRHSLTILIYYRECFIGYWFWKTLENWLFVA